MHLPSKPAAGCQIIPRPLLCHFSTAPHPTCGCIFTSGHSFLCMSVRTEPFLAAQDDEEAVKEKPAKKQTREEDVFAGNKNLRSDDQKFREMHDDRLTCHTFVIACWHITHKQRQAGALDDMQHDIHAKERLVYPRT